MRLCSKCKIEKDDTNYGTYYHSTQKKERTRNICNSCFNEQKRLYRESIRNKKIIQPVVLELEIEPITTIDPTPEPIIFIKPKVGIKVCNKCKTEKPVEDFYGRLGHCKLCEMDIDHKRRLDKKIENGGSLKVPTLPNTYFDLYQKQNTFELLESMGWSFNQENGIWWKEGIKTKDGIFNNITSLYKKRVNNYTLEEMKELKDMRDRGMTFQQIQKEKRIAPATLIKVIQKYNDENS